MARQSLRDWVHRYNAEGLVGLCSQFGPGSAPLLNEAQMAALKELVVKLRLEISSWTIFALC